MSEINSYSGYASRYNTNMDYSTLFGGGAPYIDSGMGGINVSDGEGRQSALKSRHYHWQRQ